MCVPAQTFMLCFNLSPPSQMSSDQHVKNDAGLQDRLLLNLCDRNIKHKTGVDTEKPNCLLSWKPRLHSNLTVSIQRPSFHYTSYYLGQPEAMKCNLHYKQRKQPTGVCQFTGASDQQRTTSTLLTSGRASQTKLIADVPKRRKNVSQAPVRLAYCSS